MKLFYGFEGRVEGKKKKRKKEKKRNIKDLTKTFW